MRRLMTGYAVTFNIRHRRSGHLFQNRYKSVVCEEEAYLLELTRYIHLNPLRAKLVKDLKELDRYLWTGHSVLLGKRKNPLVPDVPFINAEGNNGKPLTENTVADVLRYFGDSLRIARTNYRRFVEKGIKHGRRTELQGGGLVRSCGGGEAGLLGLKKEDREKSDQRILGSGDFVNTTLKQAEKILAKKYLPKRPIEELIEIVAGKLGLRPELICSKNRQRQYSEARSLLAWLAVEEVGHPAAEVARHLGISRVGVLLSLEKAKGISQKYGFQLN